jgi:hypothetical protein
LPANRLQEGDRVLMQEGLPIVVEENQFQIGQLFHNAEHDIERQDVGAVVAKAGIGVKVGDRAGRAFEIAVGSGLQLQLAHYPSGQPVPRRGS